MARRGGLVDPDQVDRLGASADIASGLGIRAGPNAPGAVPRPRTDPPPSRPVSAYATPPEMSRENSRSGSNGYASAGPSTGTAPVRNVNAPYSHQAYSLGGPTPSTSAWSSVSSLLPRSPSSSSFASMSPSMERSRSTGSESHSRQQSLTSACAPVTSTHLGAPLPQVDAYSPRSSAESRNGQGRSRDWGAEAEKAYSSDGDVREGAKRRTAERAGPVDRILDAPGAVLSYMTRPLRATIPSTRLLTTSPALHGTLPAASGKKKSPLAIRLAIIAYLAFSFLYLTFSLPSYIFSSSSYSGKDTDIATRLGADQGGAAGWQVVRDYADGLGAKAGFDLPWLRSSAAATTSAVKLAADADVELNVDGWGKVERIGNPDDANKGAPSPHSNPLTPFTHTYRFSKMHDKVHWDLHDEIIPFAFSATAKVSSDDATALMYSNDAWLDTLPPFVKAWRGPVSLVFETAHSRHDTARRTALLSAIKALRDAHPLVKQFVDFHILGVPTSMSERSIDKARERMIRQPFARNFHLNLARFFASTDIIFLAGDARITPSGGLRRKLTEAKAREIMLERGDALVVPMFGFLRDAVGEPSRIATTGQLREQLGLSTTSDAYAGVRDDEFEAIAAQHLGQLYESLPIAPEDWPNRKQTLVQLANTRSPTVSTQTMPQLALFDRRWEPNRGPSNWYLWRKSAADPRLNDEPAAGGGVGLGLDGNIGGGREPFKVVDYDLHYAPLVAMSRKGHPWCTERFDDLRAACTYQMFLSGAEMFVLPEDWAYTLEVLEKNPSGYREDPAEKLKNSISSRLYGKFHQEACMHYGREFLSVGMWDSDKAQHLRETCARTLGTWGMGAA